MRRAAAAVAVGLGCIATLSSGANELAFEPGAPRDVHGRPTKIARADFDGDPFADLVTWGGSGGELTVFHGNGDGTLSTGTLLTAPEEVYALGLADLDGDGVDDIVTGHRGAWVDLGLPAGMFATAGGVHVLISDGQGGFDGTAVTIHGRGPQAILFLDLDGDTDLDVVIGHGDGTSTLTNDGSGGLSNPQTITTDWMTRTRAVADLDADGNPDLVGNVTLWGEADGSFTPGSALLDIAPLAAADIDGDGDVDLVGLGEFDPVTPGSLAELAVARNLGGGTFAAAIGVPAVRGPLFGVLAEDVDGDGLPELITSSQWGEVGVLRNEGGGTFADPLRVPHGDSGIPWGYAVAHVDADGHADLVTVDPGSVEVEPSVIAHLQTGGDAPCVTAIMPSRALAGASEVVVVVGDGLVAGTTVDFGPGVTVQAITQTSVRELRASIEVDPYDEESNSGGVREIRVRTPDGLEATATFEILPGAPPVVTAVTPDTLVAGTSEDLVISGRQFSDSVELALGPHVRVNGFVRVSDRRIEANVTATAAASPGAVPLRVTNLPSRRSFESAASAVLALVGPRTLDLQIRRGTLKDKSTAGRDSLVVTGEFRFNGFSPDGTLSVPDDALVLEVGDPSAPFTLEIPAGDGGWRVGRRTLAWRSGKGSKPKVALRFDPDRGTFKVSVRKADLHFPVDERVVLDLEVGDDTGRDLGRWIRNRVDRLRLR